MPPLFPNNQYYTYLIHDRDSLIFSIHLMFVNCNMVEWVKSVNVFDVHCRRFGNRSRAFRLPSEKSSDKTGAAIFLSHDGLTIHHRFV